MIADGGARADDRAFDICVVGAGPAGLAVAFACAERGRTVAVLEAGGLKPGLVSTLSIKNLTPQAHDAIERVSRAGLGGTSSAWGGTCVPFDRADFEPQWWDDRAGWPIPYEEMSDWYREATRFLGVQYGGGYAGGHAVPGDILDVAQVHRIGAQPDMGILYRKDLQKSETITVFLNTELMRLRPDEAGSRIGVAETRCADAPGIIRARHFVLAAGGLASTQILLRLAAERPFGHPLSPLGRYYMGHVGGVIATLVFDRPAEAANFLYAGDGGGGWSQRRIKIQAARRYERRLLNTAFVLRSPDTSDHRHRNGALSALNLLAPGLGSAAAVRARRGALAGADRDEARNRVQHLKNIMQEPIGTVTGLGKIVSYSLKRNLPRLVLNAGGRYALDYHGEQVPDRDSRVYLDPGDPRSLCVDFRYVPVDLDSIVLSHELLDQALRDARIGHLEYFAPAPDRLALVSTQASDGYHQIGTTRMATSPEDGVVDSECRVHGLDNLHVASSSVFPTSGSANPTLTTVALARRLGARLSEATR
jgi:choline dehydrogenase-like flavoprotein